LLHLGGRIGRTALAGARGGIPNDPIGRAQCVAAAPRQQDPASMITPAVASSAAPLSTSPDAAPNDEPLRLFDGLAPFFLDEVANSDDLGRPTATNWSKIPFAQLERDGRLDPARAEAALTGFERHVAAMAAMGYTGVVLDDLSHLVSHPFYPSALQSKLASYRPFYDRLFAAVKRLGLRLFVTTDYFVGHPTIDRHLRETGQTPADLFAQTIAAAWESFPALDGLVLRIGESDGVDVEDDLKSQLAIRHPREVRALLGRLLPEFERRGKTLIFRTWTLGAFPVGDLMWNRRTYDAAFGQLASPNLIVSLKYGDADFFRYLALNPLFFHGPQRKLIELQTRREYEGMGEYPSFVGWDYARYLAELRAGGSNLAGVYALQAGGWAPFARLTHCDRGSFWNELNAQVTVAIARGRAVEATIADLCRERGIADPERFLRFLRLAETAIADGLYIREFAERTVYFRRIRIPPLIWVFWHHATAGGVVATLHRHLVRDKAAAVAEGHRAVETVREMLRLAEDLGLAAVVPGAEDDLRFQLATFEILAELRAVLLGVETAGTRRRLAALLPAYSQRYPTGYRFDVSGGATSARAAHLLLRLLLRHRMEYRRGDRVLLDRHVTRLKALALRRLQSRLPRFVGQQGMTAEALLR